MIDGVMNRSHWNKSRKLNMGSSARCGGAASELMRVPAADVAGRSPPHAPTVLPRPSLFAARPANTAPRHADGQSRSPMRVNVGLTRAAHACGAPRQIDLPAGGV